MDSNSGPPASPSPPTTPPNNPMPPSSEKLSPDLVKEVLEILRLVKTIQDTTPITSKPTEPKNEITRQQNEGKASRLEYATVNEIWDNKLYKYKIVESTHVVSKVVDEWEQYVFVVRQRLGQKDVHSQTFIDVKSDGLRDILREVLKDVRGICLREDKPEVQIEVLFHYLDQLKAYSAGLSSDSGCIEHLNHLTGYLDKHFTSQARKFQSLLEHREITFNLLWALFKPNTLVYTKCAGSDEPRCLKFDFGQEKKTPEGVKYFKLDCRFLGHDGKCFGEIKTSLYIVEFQGTMLIKNLSSCPLSYQENKSKLRSLFIKRGQKYLSLMDINHRCYKGNAFFMENGEPTRIYVEGRIMIDAEAFHEANPNYEKIKIDESTGFDFAKYSIPFGQSIVPSSKNLDRVKQRKQTPLSLVDDDLMCCSPTVFGFSLGDKIWAEFAVSRLEDIAWNLDPFQYLVLPQEHKSIVKALATSHKSKEDFDDLVKGKGKGLIVLLHGPPGVGKTLTAEGIAEHLHKPLYSVSAGDLQKSCDVVEKRLSQIFKLANHWNAVVLLDEADAFLEQRSRGDVLRNSSVSVFLRHLEYFQGVMFLTTNRVETFDEAILSRVHVPLRYSELRKDARTSIWETFLRKAGMEEGLLSISEGEREKLTEKKLNGRQIKNAVRVASALAQQNRQAITFTELSIAVKRIAEFERDFRGPGSCDSMSSYF
ncbi:MAG: hypothetical protein M1814_002246 [Vezdaea aestivalis]|nr:MAG: hypothetical protein M1814_002246 [Vezdaea aestivalis]